MRSHFRFLVLALAVLAAAVAGAQSLDVTFVVGGDTHIRDTGYGMTDIIATNHVTALNEMLGPDGKRLAWPAGAFSSGPIAQPDAVFIAGDLLNGLAASDKDAVALLQSLYLGTDKERPKLKAHAYLGAGNHDFAFHSSAFTYNAKDNGNKIRELVLQSSKSNRFSVFESSFGVAPPHYAVTLGGGKLLVVVLSPSLAEPCRQLTGVGLHLGNYAAPDSSECNAAGWLETTLKNFVAANGGNTKAPVIIVQHYGYDDIGTSNTGDGWRGFWWHPDMRERLASIIKGYNVVAIVHAHTHTPHPDPVTKSSAAIFGDDLSTTLDVGYNNTRGWADVTGDGKKSFCRLVEKDGNTIARCTKFDGMKFGSDIESGKLDNTGEVDGRAWVDVNGDGKADFCRVTYQFLKGNKLRCELSTGTAFSGAMESGSLDTGWKSPRAWVDVNNDGRVDYCRTLGSNQAGCVLSKSEGFVEAPAAKIVHRASPVMFADANGDGFLDYCYETIHTGNKGYPRCNLFDSNTNSFSDRLVTSASPIDLGDTDGMRFVDIDGDKKADFCRTTDYVYVHNSIGAIRCTLSTGSAFSGDRVSAVETYPGGALARGLDLGYSGGRAWTNFEGAGKELNYCRVIEADSKAEGRVACANFGRVSNSSRRIDPGYYGGRTWVDVNGDGRSDYCRVYGSDSSNGTVACLLTATALTAPPVDAFSVASGFCSGDAGGNVGGFSVVHVTDTTFELMEVEKAKLPSCGEAAYNGSVFLNSDGGRPYLTKKLISTR
ncbi:MAG TPA: metallophosphoesterase [Thermoanaerobaculia bacterium]|nr:metallophosphoesterase [Thermoanaerobaculia bacterium]